MATKKKVAKPKKKVSDLAVSAGKAAKVKGGPTPHRKRTVVLQQS